MITSITFQHSYNCNYIPTEKKYTYADLTISSLVDNLLVDVEIFKNIAGLVYELNKDLERTDIAETINQFLPGGTIRITHKTKKKRTYFIVGLTIHEQDIN